MILELGELLGALACAVFLLMIVARWIRPKKLPAGFRLASIDRRREVVRLRLEEARKHNSENNQVVRDLTDELLKLDDEEDRILDEESRAS